MRHDLFNQQYNSSIIAFDYYTEPVGIGHRTSGVGVGFGIAPGSIVTNTFNVSNYTAISLTNTGSGIITLQSNTGAILINSIAGSVTMSYTSYIGSSMTGIAINSTGILIQNTSGTGGNSIINNVVGGTIVWDNGNVDLEIHKSNVGRINIHQESAGVLQILHNQLGNLFINHSNAANGLIILQNDAPTAGGITLQNTTSGNFIITNLAAYSKISINANNINSYIELLGGQRRDVDIEGSSATVTAGTHEYYLLNTDTLPSDITLNLPTAVSLQGRVYKIKNIGVGTYNVIVTPYGADTIENQANLELTTLDSVFIVSDGVSNWYIIS